MKVKKGLCTYIYLFQFPGLLYSLWTNLASQVQAFQYRCYYWLGLFQISFA